MSSICTEHDLSQVVSLKAYGMSQLSVAAPVFSCTPKILSTDITIHVNQPICIPFATATLKINDKVTRNVAGQLHTVTLEWEAANPTDDLSSDLAKLTHSPHNLLIEYFGGFRQLIRTSQEGYAFHFERDTDKLKCSMKLTNGHGLTNIVDV